MALRIEKTAFILIVSGVILAAQDLTFSVRHNHLHKYGVGTLTFTENTIQWEEPGKSHEHSQLWTYEQIQRLELAQDQVRIVTYEDIRWQVGRDRAFLFDHIPADLASRVYPFLIAKLDQRFQAHVYDPSIEPIYETPAKLLLGRAGSNGVLKIGPDRITFNGGDRGQSRTWRYSDITIFSNAGPFDLTLATLEGENRIQLKRPLPEATYTDLWRRISESNGLTTYNAQVAHAH